MEFEPLNKREPLKEIAYDLGKSGWTVKLERAGEPLKYPYAINPNRTIKLWFRKKAVLVGPFGGQMSEARSLGITIDELHSRMSDEKTVSYLANLEKIWQ